MYKKAQQHLQVMYGECWNLCFNSSAALDTYIAMMVHTCKTVVALRIHNYFSLCPIYVIASLIIKLVEAAWVWNTLDVFQTEYHSLHFFVSFVL